MVSQKLRVRLDSSIFEEKVVFEWDSGADLEKVFKRLLLSWKGVNHWSFLDGQGGFAKVSEESQDWVPRFELRFANNSVLNSAQDFSQGNQVEDERSSQEGVLANVVDGKSVNSVHENVGGVLVDGFL